MPVTSSTAQELFIGAGEVYLDGNPVGATTDNNVFRVVREYFAPQLNGTPGPLYGTDYVKSETAELQVSIPELDHSKLALMVPGSAAMAKDGAGVAATTPTTLAAATAVGAVTFAVADASQIVAGDIIQIGGVGAREFREVVSVSTNTITIGDPLALAHAAGDPVVTVKSTMLVADAPAGAKNLKVASVADLVAGGYVRFGVPGAEEVALISQVGTAGAGGTGVDLVQTTTLAHSAGDPVIPQTGVGTVTVSSTSGTSRRIPSYAYHDWELRIAGLDGREIRFGLRKAIMTESAEFEARDDGSLAPRLTLQARWDPASGDSPWYITKIGA